jgi:predicted membrane protein DUF2142
MGMDQQITAPLHVPGSGAARSGILTDTAVAAAFVLLVALWSLITPLHGAPDELNHLFFLEYLHEFGRVPQPQVDPSEPYVGGLTGKPFAKTDFWYHGLPFLHVLGGLGTAELFSPAFPGHEYLAARSFNWLLGGVFLFALLRTLRSTGLRSSTVIPIAVLIAAIPQCTYIFAYFNHDAFGLAAVALALHAFLRVIREPEDGFNAVYFGAACGLVLLAKPYHWPALVFFALMLLLARRNSAGFPLKAIALRAIAACIVVSGPMLAWTYYAFGEVTGHHMLKYVLSVVPDFTSESLGLCYVWCEQGLVNWSVLAHWGWSTFKSFFGNFGWLNLPLPGAVYLFWFLPLTLAYLLLSCGFVAQRVVRFRTGNVSLFDAAFVTLTVLMLVGVVAMSLALSQTLTPQAQGRYLFVILPFAGYAIALFAKYAGARAARDTPKNSAPGKVDLILALLATIMVMVNLYAALAVVGPAKLTWAGKQPFLSLPTGIARLSIEHDLLARSILSDGTRLAIDIPVKPDAVKGSLDVLGLEPWQTIYVSGWALNLENNEPAAFVVLFHKGKPIHVVDVGFSRPDVALALKNPNARRSGYQDRFLFLERIDPCAIEAYAVTHRLTAGKLQRADGICPD